MSTLINRRAACAAIAGAAVFPALAQSTWPRQAVRVIVPYGAGSAPDVMMRIIGDKLSAHLGQPVVVDNKPGAGGIVAVQAMNAARDAHTFIFMLTGVAVISPILYKAARYDVVRDFASIAGIAETSVMLVASPSARARTLPDIIRAAKETPGKLVIGHPGPGSLAHLMLEQFAQLSGAKFLMAGFNATHGPLAVAGGDADYYMDGIATQLPFVKARRTIPVAVFSPEVLPGLEAYPLAKNALPGAEGMGYFGIMGPKNLSADAIARLSNALKSSIAEPDVVARLLEFATYPKFSTGAQYAATLAREKAQWSGVVAAAGIEPQ
ncbi:MAG TPA: tripartite tricarboxylate transporter substrate binding protein [Ramlibacter sp.]|nr:tripartite tricarboxylate transporter substrate binding protein [Ramlibacter sp.]